MTQHRGRIVLDYCSVLGAYAGFHRGDQEIDTGSNFCSESVRVALGIGVFASLLITVFVSNGEGVLEVLATDQLLPRSNCILGYLEVRIVRINLIKSSFYGAM